MVVLFGIFTGLLYNYLFVGLNFSTLLCVIAGFTLILPLFLKIKFSDLKNLLSNKKFILFSFGINFVLLPLIAAIFLLIVKFLNLFNNFDFYSFALAFLLLIIAPGG